MPRGGVSEFKLNGLWSLITLPAQEFVSWSRLYVNAMTSIEYHEYHTGEGRSILRGSSMYSFIRTVKPRANQ